MEILPKNLGTRPRLAVEMRPEGIVAARAEDASALLTAVAERALPEGAFVPGLKAGSFVDQAKVLAALREALDTVAARAERARYVTLVVPDASVRVLLLEFDELPTKPVEALPIVRFRLKKLVPFDVEHAMVSYQVMPGESGMVRVLAVAIPADVLAEYESAITATGYLPGAVLPSTLAALAALNEQAEPILAINASRGGVTTAIVRNGTLLLHRSLELVYDSLDPVQVPVMHSTGGYDRIEAEARIEAEILAAAEEERGNAREIAQAVSVAAAYFEDTLFQSPHEIIAAGTVGADQLRALLEANNIAGLAVREAVGAEALAAGVGSRGSRGWLAGVRGALRN